MKILFLIFFLIATVPAHATTGSDDSFAEGNQAFAEGRYPDAIQAYESTIASQGYAAPVLFNLANAYDQAGKIGLALANYERARLLAPRDPDVIANETLVRRQAGLATNERVWEQAAEYLSPDLWAWFLTGTVFLGCGLAFMGYVRAGRRGTVDQIGRCGLCLAILTAVVSIAALGVWNGERSRAWATVSEAPVRLSPFDAAQTSFTLADGAEVRIEGHHDDYLLVRDPKGETGWLRKDQAAALIP